LGEGALVSRPVRTVEDAAAYLDGLINRERPQPVAARVSLRPIRALLSALGHPEADLPILHIAGSKGKGSTALAAEALLRECGSRVGVFTSPHLERWTERFRIGGGEVGGDALAAAVEQLRPHVDRLREHSPEDAPSFFDATTAAALLLFREHRVDHAVLEVGLGGRLDSTNAVHPAVTCITSIELEHTDKLGHTEAAIATEKAGILEPGVPLVSGPLSPEAEEAVAGRVRELGVPWARLGRELVFQADDLGADGSRLRLEDGGLVFEGRVAVPGTHHAANAALALACVRRLLPGLAADELAEAARRGFAELRLPGRTEVVARCPGIVVDAAHTAASARALVSVLAHLPRRRTHLVLSVSADKDLGAILGSLLPEADVVTVTRAEPLRSLDPRELALAVRSAAPGVELRVVPNPHLALRAARETLGSEDLLVATGSFYLAGLARRIFGEAPAPVRVSRRPTAGRGASRPPDA
jgi:dihydrofolate synthase/folylpolyglutamate synthase